MALDTQQMMLIEQRVANDGPSMTVAFLLWFFLGLFSGHRWYLGKGGSAALQMLSYFILIGFVWWLIDGFRIGEMVRQKKDEIRQRVTLQLMAGTV